MFEQYGTDYANAALQLNSLLPAVNQSEATNSFLSTLFQRWLTKPNLANSAGTIGFTKTPLASAIQETTAIRQAYQLYPVFYREQGDEQLVMDWNDVLRKLAFTGVDPTKYDQWGATSAFDFSPPINADKFVNYQNYYWVNRVNTIEQPDYVTITQTATTNDWSANNKWMHKDDVGGDTAFAKQAQLPIIEFDDIELCRWYTVQRTWKKLNPILGEYVDTTEQPDWVSPTYVPTDDFADLVDINWQLQSETLLPTGDTQYNADGSSAPMTLPASPAEGVLKYTNSVTKMARCGFRLGGVDRLYLRNQNDIIVMLGVKDPTDPLNLRYIPNQYHQITNFLEVENAELGQYGIEIDIPVSSLDGADTDGTPVFAYIGAHCTTDAALPVAHKLINLAPGFTSFTPASGAAFSGPQRRTLYRHKLLGQRCLTKYQLPLFNLYTLVTTGDVGVYSNQTTAGYVLKYNQDFTKPIDTQLGQRVATSATDFPFVLDLVSATGALLTYKSNTEAGDGHFTVWKNKTTHTPSYVDASRVPLVDKTLPGGWEPSRLLTDNPLRETRASFTYGQVITHFQQLAAGLPGTIKISDDGGNYLMSSLIADTLSIPSLTTFIADQLYTYRVDMEQQIKLQLLNSAALRSTATADIPRLVYNTLRAAALTEGGTNATYDDTLSYDVTTNLGYPNFPLTFGILGLCQPVSISVESDRKLDHAAIVTHDGSRYPITSSQQITVSLETALSSATVTGSTFPLPTANYCTWRKSSVETYRFECYYFVDSTPTSPEVGRTWFNPSTGTASVWTGAYWEGIAVNTLWTLFDVSSLILEVFALQERDIVKLITARNLSVIDDILPATSSTLYPQYDSILTASYSKFAYQYSQLDKPLSSRLLSAISSTDPFTWFYGNVQLANVNWPSIPHWANSVFELYTLLYGTPIPHKQPWRLQGQQTKPTWWDAAYLDTTGLRYWSITMWKNIASGTVPYGKALADGTIGTGITNQITAYAVIPVNTSSTTIGGYTPDDLLPPYVDTVAYPDFLDLTVMNDVNVVLISAFDATNPTGHLGVYTTFPSEYGQGSFSENIWISNEASVSRKLIAAYQVDPLVVVTKLSNRNRKMVGGLSINARTNNVPKNTDPLHGEDGVVDTTLFSALTFFARHHNFSSHNSSPLYSWKSWSTRLAYQTNSLVVPHTLKIYQDCYDLNEYKVVLKKSENVRTIPFSNVVVTLDSIDSAIVSTGRGENWKFRLNCSEADPTVRRKYNSLQQSFTWSAAAAAFVPAVAGETLRWFAGEHLQIVNPPPAIVDNSFYIGNKDGAIRLYSNEIDAVAGVTPIDFGSSTFTDTVQFRTIKATFTAGNLNWETVEVDRRSVQSFTFADNIVVTGVQALIDFIVCYTEYMQDDGIVINAGETPALDPDTNAVISWQQQITKAVDKIFASNGLSAIGYRPVFVPNAAGVMKPIAADRMNISIPFVEINPYRNAVYFNTPDGVICDFERTPYVNELTSSAAIYDDTATAITAAELVPLRTDRLTSVVFNDTQPPRPVNVSQDVSRRIAFGEISLDFYEHVIVFDQQTSNGLTIFDRFFNLQKTFLNLEFQKSVDFFYRPVMGGFSVTQSGTIPNFETAAEYQRNNYNVADSNELIQSTIDSRQMLGKLPLSYFQNIPVTAKTEFQFWQQMIREKGTKGSINAFTRHKLYDDVSYDEFWAWKLGTFGAVEARTQLEMSFQLGDVLYKANTFYFSDAPLPDGTTSYHYTQVAPLDQSRWIDFPDYLDQVGVTGPIFGQTGNLPAYNEISPVRVIDKSTKVVVKTLPAWDPANGIHTNALAQFDYNQPTDPAFYNRTLSTVSASPWGANYVGQYFLDSSSLVYKPYFDDTVFPLLDDRVNHWGELADGYTITAYQWVESDTAPSITSRDGPLTRHVLKSRPSANYTVSGSLFTLDGAAPSVPFVNNSMVVVYAITSTTPSAAVDAVVGLEYMVQNVSGNTFSLIADGVVLTLSSTNTLMVASTWADATTTELPTLTTSFFARDLAPGASTVTLPSSWATHQDLTSSAAIVNINGIATAFGISEVGVVSLVNADGSPRSLIGTDIVTVTYSQQAMSATGMPILSDPALTYVDIDVPHTEHTQTINQLAVTKYYYWSSIPTLVNNPVKTLPLTTAVLQLTRPQSGDYMAIHTNRQLMTIWGLYGTHQLDNKALAIDIDKTMRDKYLNPAVSKPSNEQWVLFREYQDGYPNSAIWDAVVATVVGTRAINPTSTIIVPTPDRVSYDYLYDTTLSYGTGVTQTLIPPVRARELFTSFFSVANPLIDGSLHVLLTGNTWTTLMLKHNYAGALDFVYTNLPSTLLNSFIFVILREGLYSGYQYAGLFKTSYVALQTSQKVVVG